MDKPVLFAYLGGFYTLFQLQFFSMHNATLFSDQYVFERKLPRDVLSAVFGYSDFRGEQADIIDDVIGGKSLLVLMPTGSGKSLCYQIPALCRNGVGIVISPLIALMQDQVMALREAGVRAATIHSAQGGAENEKAMDDLRSGALDLIYVAPERLVHDRFLDVLDHIDISLFAVDEAHCISQWGHDFRPEYRQISLLRTRYADVPCIAVTATADVSTRKDIAERLEVEKTYVAGFDRPNISYEVGVKTSPRSQLSAFLKTCSKEESGIVYCLSRRKVEETAQWLCDQGYNALPYHARLDMDVRSTNQERFLKEEGVIIVATIAFGMGINKPDVRFVAHLDLPKNIEAYYQETGRAGRDGLPARAWMVYGLQDVALQRQMIESSGNPEEQKRLERHKLNAFLGFCESATCRRQVLLRYFDDDCDPCGNCDACLSPPKVVDGTVSAQKLLSCIYRTGQMFGAGYVVDVLLGKDNERIRQFGHDGLSTFGIGTEHRKAEWQGVIRQLVARGLVFVDMEAHGVLKITAEGAAFLKGKETIELRVDTARPQSSVASVYKGDVEDMLRSPEERNLFRDLRALRMDIAKENQIPPYMVFHDKTLVDMVRQKPSTMDALSRIGGVGASKLARYGAAFLDMLMDRRF